MHTKNPLFYVFLKQGVNIVLASAAVGNIPSLEYGQKPHSHDQLFQKTTERHPVRKCIVLLRLVGKNIV